MVEFKDVVKIIFNQRFIYLRKTKKGLLTQCRGTLISLFFVYKKKIIIEACNEIYKRVSENFQHAIDIEVYYLKVFRF